jgi:hypothetical protein
VLVIGHLPVADQLVQAAGVEVEDAGRGHGPSPLQPTLAAPLPLCDSSSGGRG